MTFRGNRASRPAAAKYLYVLCILLWRDASKHVYAASKYNKVPDRTAAETTSSSSHYNNSIVLDARYIVALLLMPVYDNVSSTILQ